jgi:hypothetical protein
VFWFFSLRSLVAWFPPAKVAALAARFASFALGWGAGRAPIDRAFCCRLKMLCLQQNGGYRTRLCAPRAVQCHCAALNLSANDRVKVSVRSPPAPPCARGNIQRQQASSPAPLRCARGLRCAPAPHSGPPPARSAPGSQKAHAPVRGIARGPHRRGLAAPSCLGSRVFPDKSPTFVAWRRVRRARRYDCLSRRPPMPALDRDMIESPSIFPPPPTGIALCVRWGAGGLVWVLNNGFLRRI